ncbi:MAG: hypothetical protein Q9207_008533, partial [Kuettlingeria erythrocarpa]
LFRSTYLHQRFILAPVMTTRADAKQKANAIINNDCTTILALCKLLGERCITDDRFDPEPRLQWEQGLCGLRCKLFDVTLPALGVVQHEMMVKLGG